MPIVISDTLTGTKRELVPVEPGKIRNVNRLAVDNRSSGWRGAAD